MKDIDFNLKCHNFKENISNIINASDLPIAVAYYIWKNIGDQLEKAYYAAINTALVDQEEKKEEVE